MPDIAMCKGYELLTGSLQDGGTMRVCPRAKQCYRHTASPNGDRQAWFAKLPLVGLGRESTCEYYLEVRPLADALVRATVIRDALPVDAEVDEKVAKAMRRRASTHVSRKLGKS